MPSPKPKRKRVSSAGPLPLLTGDVKVYLLYGFAYESLDLKRYSPSILRALWQEHGARLTEEHLQGKPRGMWRPWAEWAFELGVGAPYGWTRVVGPLGDEIQMPDDLLYLHNHGLFTEEEEAEYQKYLRQRPRAYDGLPQGYFAKKLDS